MTINDFGTAPGGATSVFDNLDEAGFDTDGTNDLDNLDLQDATNSGTAITHIDNAFAKLNTVRATLGAAINRLEYAADNLANVSQNTSASRSRVLDTDYAAETTELAKTQIIQQAATAMLAQANQYPQTVLALLQ